jgi:hypothetical protein
MLPEDVSLWGFNLVTQFHDALSYDLQDAILTDLTFHMPILSSLTSRTAQLSALRLIRTCSVRHHLSTIKQEKIVHRMLARAQKNKGHPLALSANLSAFSTNPSTNSTATVLTSPAEFTMSKYRPDQTSPEEFPIDPLSNYQSQFPVCFRGCIVCGRTDHQFKDRFRHVSHHRFHFEVPIIELRLCCLVRG